MFGLKISCLVLLCLGAVRGYSDCGSETGTLVGLEIPGCPDPEVRCILHKNTNASVTLEFTTKEPITSLKAVVHGIVLGAKVPFPLPNPDGCVDSGLTCPLSTGNNYRYVATLPVLKKYPKVTVDIQWELKDQDEKDVVCIKIPAKIQ